MRGAGSAQRPVSFLRGQMEGRKLTVAASVAKNCRQPLGESAILLAWETRPGTADACTHLLLLGRALSSPAQPRQAGKVSRQSCRMLRWRRWRVILAVSCCRRGPLLLLLLRAGGDALEIAQQCASTVQPLLWAKQAQRAQQRRRRGCRCRRGAAQGGCCLSHAALQVSMHGIEVGKVLRGGRVQRQKQRRTKPEESSGESVVTARQTTAQKRCSWHASLRPTQAGRRTCLARRQVACLTTHTAPLSTGQRPLLSTNTRSAGTHLHVVLLCKGPALKWRQRLAARQLQQRHRPGMRRAVRHALHCAAIQTGGRAGQCLRGCRQANR